MFKKGISVLLATSMIISMAGCGNSGKNDTKESKASKTATLDQVKFPLEETKEYDVFAIMNMTYDLKDNPVIKKTEKDDNLKFNFKSVMGSDLQEKRNLVLSSGEYPDVFYKAGLTQDEAEKYGKQGVFIPLEDLIKEYAPNLTKLLDERDGWDTITALDGHVYTLPCVSKPDVNSPYYWINKKWLDNLGLSVPTSLDELYNVLKAFKEEDANGNGDPNDEIPMTATDVVKPELLMPYFDICYDSLTKLAVVNDELTYIPQTDTFKEYIAYITKLYKEGLLDKNAFTQKHEQQGAIGQAGDVLGSYFDAASYLTVGRDNDRDFIALPPFEKGTYPLKDTIVPGGMEITDTCENPEVMIAWVDQFYSEDGGIMAYMGIENETWEAQDDGTWKWLLGNGYGDDVTNIRSSAALQGAAVVPAVKPDFWDKMSPDVDPGETYLMTQRKAMVDSGKVPLPALHYSQDDLTELSTIKADVDSYIDQYVSQVATGKLDLEDSWNEYQSMLKDMRADRMVEIYQKAYEQATK